MKTTRDLTTAAVLAALYAVLTVLQNLILPDSASAAIQFRLAEALCVAALFTPAAIWGLSLGCLLSNLLTAGALPLDFLIGTAATALATTAMYALRGVRVFRLPLPALLMPALCNGLLVGAELTVCLGALPFWVNALFVALGEAAVLTVAGIPFWAMLRRVLRGNGGRICERKR